MDTITEKVNASMEKQCKARGFATAVDVLLDMGVLTPQKVSAWRSGRIDYLEHVCVMNPKKLSAVLLQMKTYGAQNHLKPSGTIYKYQGTLLRFSKSGGPQIEKAYATHYVVPRAPISSASTL